MRNEKMDDRRTFGEVVPGISVSSDIEITIPHPEVGFVIRDQQDENSWAVGGSLAVFSSEEAAEKYLEKIKLTGTVIKPFDWNQLVDKFSEGFENCIVDHSGEAGFQTLVPLRKGI